MKSLLLRSAALLAIAALFAALPTAAQKRYTIDPSNSVTGAWEPEKNPDVEQLDIKIHVYNTTETEFGVSWSVVKSTFPAAWLPQVCDNANCFEYADLVGKVKTMNVGAKSGPSYKQGEFKVTAYPKDYGTGITVYGVETMRIAIFDPAKPQEIDTLSFTAKVEVTSVHEDVNAFPVEISPNPAGERLTVKSGASSGMLSVISALGIVQFEASLENGYMLVNLSALPHGVYFVKITDAAGKQSVRKFVRN